MYHVRFFFKLQGTLIFVPMEFGN